MKKIQDLGVNDVVHCPTLEEAERILKMAHRLGLKWSSGASFLDNLQWELFEDRTAYLVYQGQFGGVGYYESNGYTIHRASEFFESGAGLLPEKWAILIDSQEVIDIVGKWLDGDSKFESQWRYKESGLYYFVFPGVRVSNLHHEIPAGYTRISLEQFKEVYPQIREGDWVYFGDRWETVMQFNRKDRTLASCGINSYTRYIDGGIEFRENDVTSSPIRLATQEELARIRDAYRPAEFDDLIKELERNFQEPPAAGWKSPVAELAADQWNEALKLAINLLKDKQKV